MNQEVDVEWGVALMRAHTELAQVAEPAEIVASLVRVCEPYGPKMIHLIYIHNDDDGEPETCEVVDVWGPDIEPPVSVMVGKRFRIADFGVGRAILAQRQLPLIVPNVAIDPQIAPVLEAFPGGVQAFVGLPLYSKRHSTWQGIVAFHWLEPHDPSPAERLLYELMRTTLAESISAERTLLAYREALQESQRQRTMLQLLLDNLPIGALVLRSTDGQQELINRTGRVVLGLDPDTGSFDHSGITFHQPGADEPIPEQDSTMRRALETGETCRDEVEVRRANGDRVLLELTASPLRYEADPVLRVVALFQDITAIRQSERERLAVQEELLLTQKIALAERSIPLIPIREDVLILPLIGSVDAERGHQLLETLVHLGGRSDVRAMIIDVTGTRNLDTAAAHVLMSAAQALRLRGVQPILTGIQSDAALTLVGLGIDFSGVVVRGTLQAGVAYATQEAALPAGSVEVSIPRRRPGGR
ncbi:STAS domain-containing protein [Enhygromyxa salina]|uniref:RsbT co-antagonist protein RsbRA n=1 Tax=Enhygromyxa salina TaxID=215803 RepID=A0A2S9YUY2_9BACT|nr:STAS domain-containing protein [Enhygromyxa salina]PRQ08893.1 RsbT co-antagonist protein RsbRA [Enhygromyxa salina]